MMRIFIRVVLWMLVLREGLLRYCVGYFPGQAGETRVKGREWVKAERRMRLLPWLRVVFVGLVLHGAVEQPDKP